VEVYNWIHHQNTKIKKINQPIDKIGSEVRLKSEHKTTWSNKLPFATVIDVKETKLVTVKTLSIVSQEQG
jgi:hypothetical protein